MELTKEEQRLIVADERATDRTGYWLAAIAAFLGAAIVVIVVQSIFWLKDGEWPVFTVARLLTWLGVHVAPLDWVGAQRIVTWLLACPVAGALFAFAVLLVFMFTRHDRRAVPEALRGARIKRANSRRVTRNPD